MKLNSFNLASTVLAAVSLCLPATATAQDALQPGTIIVSGERESEEQAVTAVRHAARALRRSAGNSAIPRFVDPLCLAVAGINSEQAAILHSLVTGHFNALGIKNAAEGCSPNALVVLTAEPEEFLTKLAERQPALFTSDTRRTRTEQITRGDPAVVWVSHEPRSVMGGRLRHSAAIPGLTMPMSVETNVNSNPRPRRVGLTTSIAIKNAIIVFDSGAADGATLGQVAAYAAMRLLAFPENVPQEIKQTESILSIYESDGFAHPVGLTSFDNALLTGLYELPLNAAPARLEAATVAAFLSEVETADE